MRAGKARCGDVVVCKVQMAASSAVSQVIATLKVLMYLAIPDTASWDQVGVTNNKSKLPSALIRLLPRHGQPPFKHPTTVPTTCRARPRPGTCQLAISKAHEMQGLHLSDATRRKPLIERREVPDEPALAHFVAAVSGSRFLASSIDRRGVGGMRLLPTRRGVARCDDRLAEDDDECYTASPAS
jgi:hypothetical protein